jgi:hypothetical protein
MSENTESDPAAARKRRTWNDLSFGDRHTAEVLLEHADIGREVAENTRSDRDFTLWLLDASLAFADLVQEFPQDLADGIWRDWYFENVSPCVAARIALHHKPMVRIDGDRLVCPVCRTADEISARDVAIRYNPLHVDDGYVFGTAETPDFVHDKYICGHCDSSVRLPRGVEDFS